MKTSRYNLIMETSDKSRALEKSKDKPLYFSRWYKGEVKPINFENFSKTAKLHVKKISETRASSVLDIGCGAGGILLALQNSGVEEIHGIDASNGAISQAKKRFEKYGKLEGVNLIQGNSVDLDIPVTDAVSIHRVICCYPDVVGLLKKALEKNPRTIVFTIPSQHIGSKMYNFLQNLLMKLGSIFIPSIRGLGSYVHSMHTINKELEHQKYSQVFSKKGLVWHTYVYKKSSK